MFRSTEWKNSDREPQTIRTAMEIIGDLDTVSFKEQFDQLCAVVRQTAEFNPPGPVIAIGINISRKDNQVTRVSSPQPLWINPVVKRQSKPESLAHYDVIGMVIANQDLTVPAQVQGALLEQLAIQWYILMQNT